ncbi:hypothetical protein GJ744_004597 [Endocarpon pusillum]|uniref:Thioredoxin-like fold domain-containing protein n=1 Tax=Endocarpon pusillum TaxID=364733 RepID=A0A8H7E7T9_9EURO|nr:hypothetical protein GJ744_004597 [Endocarpon pusillum]
MISYLDYTCPYSRKLFQTLHPAITSLVTQKYSTTLRLIFRQQIQPWHPSSTLCHEAALAVLRLAPTEFWEYSAALFERQTEFFDASVVGEGRNETYGRLVRLAEERVGVDGGEMMALLRIAEGGRRGGVE